MALCLLCGQTVCAGTADCRVDGIGPCTRHASRCSIGACGAFLLLQRSTVLLLRGAKAAYYPSMYVDLNGEEDPGLMRGRPLSLSRHRLQSLEQLLWRGRVGKEVGSRQVTAESVSEWLADSRA